MALHSLTLPLHVNSLPPTTSCPRRTQSTSSSSFTKPIKTSFLPHVIYSFNNKPCCLRKSGIVRMAPDEEKMTRRSPLDFPIEWDRPKPARRPDIFPQFSPVKTPLPPPMPADPPEEDEEEDEEKKEEEEEDPEKQDQDEPAQQYWLGMLKDRLFLRC